MNVKLVSLQTALISEGFTTNVTEEIQLHLGLLFRYILLSQMNFPVIESIKYAGGC